MKALVALALVASIACAQSIPTSLSGAWRIVEVTTTGSNAATISNPQPGLYLFTGKYYGFSELHGDKPRPEADVSTATDAELVAMWRPFTGQSGTYEVSGTTLTLHPIAAKSTINMRPGRYLTFSFKLEGKTLTITMIRTSEGPVANPATTKLTRVD